MKACVVVFNRANEIAYVTLESVETIAKRLGYTIQWGRDNTGGTFTKRTGWDPMASFIISYLRDEA